MARRRSSMPSFGRPAPSGKGPSSRTASWTRWTSNGRRASRFSPRTRRSGTAITRSTLSTPQATPTSAVRSNGRSPWSTPSSCSSMPVKGRCRRPALCCARPWRWNSRSSSSSTRSTGPTPGSPRWSTRSTNCSSIWMPTSPPSISRSSTRSLARARQRSIPTFRAPTWSRSFAHCSTPFPLHSTILTTRCGPGSRISTPRRTSGVSPCAGSSTARSAKVRRSPGVARMARSSPPVSARSPSPRHSTRLMSTRPGRANSSASPASRMSPLATRWPIVRILVRSRRSPSTNRPCR